MQKETKQTGFTLVELLVTMVVLIITLAVGVPFYQSIVAKNRAIAQTNMLVSAINMAKSEAIASGASMRVCSCKPDSSGACVPVSGAYQCGSNAQWVNGWFVAPEADVIDNSGTDEVAIANVIKIWQEIEGNPVLTTNIGQMVFTSLGFKNTSTADKFEIYQTYADEETDKRCLGVNEAGLITVRKIECSSLWP